MSISYGVHSKVSVQIKSLSYFQTIENGDFLPTPCPNCQFRALTIARRPYAADSDDGWHLTVASPGRCEQHE